MFIKNKEYGEELESISTARFSISVFLILFAFTTLLSLGIFAKRNDSDIYTLFFGIFCLILLIILLLLYCLKDRSERQLVILENGLWYPRPGVVGTFVPWADIEEFQLKKKTIKWKNYWYLAIKLCLPEKYRNRLSFFRKLDSRYLGFGWGTHIILSITPTMDTKPRELIEKIEYIFQEWRKKNQEALNDS